MATPARSPVWQRALIVLCGVTVAVVATAALYWAQKILIPVALAVFISFLLMPLVTHIQRAGLGRALAVLVVVSLTVAAVGGVGWLISGQVRDLAAEMPQYTQNIKERVQHLRDLGGSDSVLDHLNRMAIEISKVWNEPGQEPPLKVQVEPGPFWLNSVLPNVPAVLELAASAALTLVLVVFMLLKREDLRNRLIWLTGRSRVALTTKALDEIGQRISRYLQTQAVINGSYGAAMALGLMVIGVEHWLLWGCLAALLRYLPYIGAPIAALFPLVLSLAQSPGWTQPLLVVGWIVALELLANNVLEPWLYGRSIGVSAVALLVAAGFWTFLWGPIGLALSGPLTVCLVVVGEYVPALRFLAVILGDSPALEPDVVLFQRLAAGDQDEALGIVLSYVREHAPEQVYDGLLLPALAHVRSGRATGELTEVDERFVLDTMQDIVDDLGTTQLSTHAKENSFKDVRMRVRIVFCPARDALDRLSLAMLQQLLDPARWEIEIAPATLLAGELLAVVERHRASAVCIGSLPPGGLAQARYLCKRLHSRFPDLKILVARWLEASAAESAHAPLREAGADRLGATILHVREQLMEWLPVLQCNGGTDDVGASDRFVVARGGTTIARQ
jgi:predicted PurR-regulated permease PerM